MGMSWPGFLLTAAALGELLVYFLKPEWLARLAFMPMGKARTLTLSRVALDRFRAPEAAAGLECLDFVGREQSLHEGGDRKRIEPTWSRRCAL